ncbi:MAG: hypothetical protein M3Q69_17120, partial [Acidobacteriota bacterium]|nr:hypothetical protein [Acidobacteriota bacterium]
AIAATLAWAIAAVCRRRPGRVWPRAWVLALASVNTLVSIAGLAAPDRASLLAFAVAGLAATATLAPRLLKLRPDSPLVQRVAPLSMIFVAVAILPTTCAVRRAIASQTERRVNRQIQQFRVWTTEINEVTRYDWRRLEESPDAAQRAVAKLKNLDFARSIDDPDMWRWASILGQDGELSSAMQQLSDAVVAGFAPERIPRVSSLQEPAVHWSVANKKWESYSRFATLSEITGTYHHELGSRFAELQPRNVAADHVKLADYQQHYAGNRETLATHLKDLDASWSDNWAAARVPGHEELTGRKNVSVQELLRTPILGNGDDALAPGDLPRLSALPLANLKRLSRGSPGCESGERLYHPSTPTGCRCASYAERTSEYYRLDCYSYAPAVTGMGADLRVEMRVVYRSAPDAALYGWNVPVEIFFHFLVPPGENADKYRQTVMTGLATVSRERSPWTALPDQNRGASFADGFRIPTNNGTVSVRPEMVTLNGLTPELSALQVRAFRSGKPLYGRSGS